MKPAETGIEEWSGVVKKFHAKLADTNDGRGASQLPVQIYERGCN
jgi:hypothetical protein